MIDVVSVSTDGEVIDRAEADDPESAIICARTLLNEASDGGRRPQTFLRVQFYVAGEFVREARIADLSVGRG